MFRLQVCSSSRKSRLHSGRFKESFKTISQRRSHSSPTEIRFNFLNPSKRLGIPRSPFPLPSNTFSFFSSFLCLYFSHFAIFPFRLLYLSFPLPLLSFHPLSLSLSAIFPSSFSLSLPSLSLCYLSLSLSLYYLSLPLPLPSFPLLSLCYLPLPLPLLLSIPPNSRQDEV